MEKNCFVKTYARIAVNTYDNLPLNKALKFPTLTILIRCIFQKYEKLYPQIYLNEWLYELVWMLEHDGIDILEGIDIKKTNASNECETCHYLYFKEIGFEYTQHFCNGCHGLIQKVISFNDVVIVYLNEVLREFTFSIWVKMVQLT